LLKYPTAVVSLVETKATLVQPWGIEFKFVEPNSAGFSQNSYFLFKILQLKVIFLIFRFPFFW
jgi:hypothetical protein